MEKIWRFGFGRSGSSGCTNAQCRCVRLGQARIQINVNLEHPSKHHHPCSILRSFFNFFWVGRGCPEARGCQTPSIRFVHVGCGGLIAIASLVWYSGCSLHPGLDRHLFPCRWVEMDTESYARRAGDAPRPRRTWSIWKTRPSPKLGPWIFRPQTIHGMQLLYLYTLYVFLIGCSSFIHGLGTLGTVQKSLQLYIQPTWCIVERSWFAFRVNVGCVL